jgi:N-carbamoyl-L-amino-acid hydrolase
LKKSKKKQLFLLSGEKWKKIKESLFKATTARFSENIMNVIESAARDFGYSTFTMMSRGFHDANNVATFAPAGMIFIPCKDGISHGVEEFATEEDIEKGANILLHTVLILAQQEEKLE